MSNENNNKFVMLSAVGIDAPGLVSSITTKIFEMGGNIIDVEENCRRGLFSIFLVIDFTSAGDPIDALIKKLKSVEIETGLKVIVRGYDHREITVLAAQENHLVTIIGADRPGIIAKISSYFAQKNINIENLKMIARGELFSMELVINAGEMIVGSLPSHLEAFEKMKNELKALCTRIDLSVVIQSEDIYKRVKKLVVFDVESSLIRSHSLHHFLNTIKDQVKAIGPLPDFTMDKEDHMRTLIDNAKILKGIPIKEFEKFSDVLQINPGTFELIGILKSMGFKIALLSSGLNFFIKKIFEVAGVDYAFANTLKVDEKGITTGELEEPIITDDTKNEVLEFILSMEDIRPEQVIAVGDGASCAHFIKKVGLSIAFQPEGFTLKTDGILKSDNIFNILYCLGISKAELDHYFNRPGTHNKGNIE